MIYVGHTEIPSYRIISPFNLAVNVTATAIPQALNHTNPNNLVANLTNPTNATTSNFFILSLFNNFLTFAQLVYTFVLFITGGFIWSGLAMFGFPPSFVFILEGVMVILIGRTILYYWKGV